MLIVMMKSQSYHRGGGITGAGYCVGLYIGGSLHIWHVEHSVHCLNFCYVVVVL